MTRCDYCLRFADDTRECVLKDGNAIRDKWSKKKQNICGKCRVILHGLFKYVKEK